MGEAFAAFPPAVKQAWTEAHGVEPTADELADFTQALKERRFRVTFGVEEHIGVMLDLVNVAYLPLFARSWFIVEGEHFATGDVPVVLWARPEIARFGLGLGTADEILMPISSTRALVIAGQEKRARASGTAVGRRRAALATSRLGPCRPIHLSAARNASTT